MVVQKYGGTSVADPDRIRAVAEHIVRTHRQGNQVIVVVSAMGKTTDDLVRLAHDVAQEPHGRELDMLLTAGERISMALLCMAIMDQGVHAVSFTGSQAGIVTDTVHGKAKILEVKGDRIRETLAAGAVAVVAGFQGISTARDITTLGRGGSDTTAVALAATLDAEVCEIYTDVSGVFTADPRVVPEARKLAARLVQRDARDGRDRRQGARAALGRVRAQLQRSRPRAIELHLGARHLGGRGGPQHGRGDHLRRHSRHVGGEDHDLAGRRPPGRRRVAVPPRSPTSR